MKRRPAGRRRADRRRASIAAVLARSAPTAVAYPGYRTPELEHRTRMAITGAALLHGAAIAVLFVIASLAPKMEDRVLHLRFLEPEPPPPPPVVEVPKPEPPPPPVHIELPKPELPKPAPKPVPNPEPPQAPPPPKPAPKPPVVKPEPLLPAPPIAPPAPVPALPRVARPAPLRESAARVPAAQIDRMAARPEFSDPAPLATHRAAAAIPRAERAVRPPPASIDRVAVARPEAAPAAPAPRAAPPPAPARAERPALMPKAAPAPRNQLRGVALSELLPCVSDAREQELKQRTVAAAQNRALCESPAGRFHFIETKNVNAFLMRIEQAAGRRSGDRCDELKLALDCIASLPPPRSRQ